MAEEIACIYPPGPIILDINEINYNKDIILKVYNKTKKNILYITGFNPINNIFEVKNKLSIIKPLSNSNVELSLLTQYSIQSQINANSFNLIFKFYSIADDNLVKLEYRQLYKRFSMVKENQKTILNLLFDQNDGTIINPHRINELSKNYNSFNKSLSEINNKMKNEIEESKKIINNNNKIKKNYLLTNKICVYILVSVIGLLIGVFFAALFKKFIKNRNKMANINNDNKDDDYNVTFLTMEEVGEIKNINQQSNELYKNIYKVNIFEEVQKEKKLKEEFVKKKNSGNIKNKNWLILFLSAVLLF